MRYRRARRRDTRREGPAPRAIPPLPAGTGAWAAALVNALPPGDRVLMFESGRLVTLWREIADKLGLVVGFGPGDWRSGADPAIVESRLGEAKARAVKAVLVVHNETSTG